MIDFSLFTDKGDREVNEDMVATVEKDGNYCFVLCDGLGGHGRGDEASALVADSIIESFSEYGEAVDFIKNAVEEAQTKLRNEQRNLGVRSQMKTTVVVLAIVNGVAKWGHVGDSRLYYFKNFRLKMRTIDHSVPQMLATAHRIKESEIRFHPDRNRLLNVLGSDDDDLKIEISKPHKLKENKSAFLLCSDGFWELVTEVEMLEIIGNKTLSTEEKIKNLKEKAFENGKKKDKDNISLILINS